MIKIFFFILVIHSITSAIISHQAYAQYNHIQNPYPASLPSIEEIADYKTLGYYCQWPDQRCQKQQIRNSKEVNRYESLQGTIKPQEINNYQTTYQAYIHPSLQSQSSCQNLEPTQIISSIVQDQTVNQQKTQISAQDGIQSGQIIRTQIKQASQQIQGIAQDQKNICKCGKNKGSDETINRSYKVIAIGNLNEIQRVSKNLASNPGIQQKEDEKQDDNEDDSVEQKEDDQIIAHNIHESVIKNDVQGSSNLRDQNDNLVIGQQNQVDGKSNIVNGQNQIITGDQNIATGTENIVKGNENAVEGHSITVQGKSNRVEGVQNTVQGVQNYVSGQKNIIQTGKDNVVSGESNFLSGELNVIEGKDNILIGKNNLIAGEDNLIIGKNNLVAVGQGNIVNGKQNTISGDSNIVQGSSNLVVGENNVVNSTPTAQELAQLQKMLKERLNI